MDEKSKFDALVIAYLAGELKAEEESRFLEMLTSGQKDEKKTGLIKDIDRLTAVKKAMNEVDIDKEWDHFKQALNGIEIQPVAEDIEVYDQHLIAEERNHKGILYKLSITAAIAASVLFLLWFGGVFDQKLEEAQQQVAHAVSEKKSAMMPREVHDVNYSGQAKSLLLEDGSEVVLEDKSEITYVLPFQNQRRDITLKGKALFKVAKNLEMPFSVYSGDLMTTALGTEFMVTSFASERYVTVRLLEGKVVVQSVDSIAKKLKSPFYLMPGQELVYDRRNAQTKIRSYRGAPVKGKMKEQPSFENPSLPLQMEGTWYMFNNQSLPNIFEQLESMFGTRIDYNSKELEKLYFIGKFDKADSLEYILRNITTINKLKLSKVKNRYVISK